MTKEATINAALTLALEVLEDWDSPLALPAIIAIKEALAQPDYRAVKTYHEGKPVYVSQTEFPPECKTVAEQTAYAFGWWKALEAVKAEQPAQEPVGWWDDKLGFFEEKHFDQLQPVYTTPQPRPWVGLTDDEIKEIVGPYGDTPIKGYTRKLFNQIEAKLKEKNHD